MNKEWKHLTVEDVESLTEEEINEVDASGQSRLHYAVKAENFEVVVALVDKGIDLHIEAKGGWIALFFTAWNKTSKIAEFLFSKGEDPNYMAIGGWAPMHEVAMNGESPEVVQSYIDAGGNVTLRCGEGKAPLYYAKEYNENPAIASVFAKYTSDCGDMAKILGNIK